MNRKPTNCKKYNDGQKEPHDVAISFFKSSPLLWYGEMHKKVFSGLSTSS